jgi:hypothetical protein
MATAVAVVAAVMAAAAALLMAMLTVMLNGAFLRLGAGGNSRRILPSTANETGLRQVGKIGIPVPML